jgi:hypothetical protein
MFGADWQRRGEIQHANSKSVVIRVHRAENDRFPLPLAGEG